ncbi:MAG: hypothetical protein JWN61_1891 [Pseudonocardiales bacterium]|nr:hypothetical protein [Pseudonocardiales bacterium]
MNDLELITELGSTIDPDAATLQRSLDELMAGITALDAAARPRQRATAAQRAWTVGPRRGGRGVAAVAVVAVVVQTRSGALVPTIADRPARPSISIPAASGSASPSTASSIPAPSDPASSDTVPGQVLPTAAGPTQSPVAANSQATLFLRKAAAVALGDPPIEPRADQFLYVAIGTTSETWLSIDGTQDGQTRNRGTTHIAGCRDGIAMVEGNAPAPRQQPCSPIPAYRPGAPTDPRAMAALLVEAAGPRNAQGQPVPPSPNQQGKELLSFIEFTWLLPASRAALYEALPLLSALTMSTAELPDRNATTVSWSFSGAEHSLLFDSSTYEYLGFASSEPGSTVTGDTSVLVQRIVDAVGLRS